MQKRAASRCGRSCSTARRRASSRPCGGSASSSSTRSPSWPRRSTSSSGAGSGRSTPPSSTGCCGRSGSSWSGARSSGRSRTCRCSRRACAATASGRRADRAPTTTSKANASFRRYVLRELEARGPLLSREIEDHRSMNRDPHDWWGARKMGLMLEVLAGRGEVAVVGRRGKQRLWDLAERWYPETERISVAGGAEAARREALPRARRQARARAAGSRTRTRSTGRCRTASCSSLRSTG